VNNPQDFIDTDGKKITFWHQLKIFVLTHNFFLTGLCLGSRFISKCSNCMLMINTKMLVVMCRQQDMKGYLQKTNSCSYLDFIAMFYTLLPNLKYSLAFVGSEELALISEANQGYAF
jgi:hypothetical protein